MENQFTLLPIQLADLKTLITQSVKEAFVSHPIEGNDNLNGFITEKEAGKLLNRKSTWFWNMKNSGKLSFTKIGATVYYSKEDIINLLKENKRG